MADGFHRKDAQHLSLLRNSVLPIRPDCEPRSRKASDFLGCVGVVSVVLFGSSV